MGQICSLMHRQSVVLAHVAQTYSNFSNDEGLHHTTAAPGYLFCNQARLKHSKAQATWQHSLLLSSSSKLRSTEWVGLTGSDKNCQAVKKMWTSSQHLSQFNKLLLSTCHITATYPTVVGVSLKLLSSNKLLILRDKLKPKQLNTKMLRANVLVVFAILNLKFIV